jgi:hypothetical protein
VSGLHIKANNIPVRIIVVMILVSSSVYQVLQPQNIVESAKCQEMGYCIGFVLKKTIPVRHLIAVNFGIPKLPRGQVIPVGTVYHPEDRPGCQSHEAADFLLIALISRQSAKRK